VNPAARSLLLTVELRISVSALTVHLSHYREGGSNLIHFAITVCTAFNGVARHRSWPFDQAFVLVSITKKNRAPFRMHGLSFCV
jgi:hypothetical protein